MRTASAPTLFAVGLLVVAAVGGITFGIASLAGVGDDGLPAAATVPTPTSDPGLTADQVTVTGVATAVTIDGAVIPELVIPIVTTPSAGLGAGARFEEVVVDGETASIAWDAGRPLVFAPDTPLVLLPAPVNLAATTASMTIALPDGSVHRIRPGDYTIDTSVAVSSGGLGEPRDTVTFTAVDTSTVAFTGGASATLAPAPLSATGPGRVALEGTFELHRPDGSITAVTGVVLESGSFRIAFAPRPDGTGFDLTDALLEGAVTVTEAPPGG